MKKTLVTLFILASAIGGSYASDIEVVKESCKKTKALYNKWLPLQEKEITQFQKRVEENENVVLMENSIRIAKETINTYKIRIDKCNSEFSQEDAVQLLNVTSELSTSATAMLPKLLMSNFDKKVIMGERDVVLMNYFRLLKSTLKY